MEFTVPKIDRRDPNLNLVTFATLRAFLYIMKKIGQFDAIVAPKSLSA